MVGRKKGNEIHKEIFKQKKKKKKGRKEGKDVCRVMSSMFISQGARRDSEKSLHVDLNRNVKDY